MIDNHLAKTAFLIISHVAKVSPHGLSVCQVLTQIIVSD